MVGSRVARRAPVWELARNEAVPLWHRGSAQSNVCDDARRRAIRSPAGARLG
jgi:hypothetical protein